MANLITDLGSKMHRGKPFGLHLHLGVPEREGIPIDSLDSEHICTVICTAYSSGIRNTNLLIAFLKPRELLPFIDSLAKSAPLVVSCQIIDVINSGFHRRPSTGASGGQPPPGRAGSRCTPG